MAGALWQEAHVLDAAENGVVLWLMDPSAETPKVHGTVVAAIFAWVEVVAFLGETFLVMVLAIASRSTLLYLLSFLMERDASATTIVDAMYDAVFVLAWLLHRYATFFHLSPRALCERLGLLRWRPLATSTKWLVVYHLAGFALVVAYQWHTTAWFLSLDNYYDAVTGQLQLARICEILLLSPIKEEIVFRGLAFHLLLNRIPSNGVAAGVASVLFGCTHLINLKHSSFSTPYVLLQTCLGIEIGLYYAVLFVQTRQNLRDSIVLHIVNNVLSSFLSTHTDFSARPIFAVLLLHAIVVYLGLTITSIRAMQAPRKAA
ncbi:hypothetical protein SPRG_20497 [Saprolegnia parasitica CBS 223.65]|uniref:CAAX prenyl protease 2/Lysostaphin resistance protein A-like domain-containing protein n=1 Tax=Saprolegnia parasitica (strain CBS 223.65) TaxID=695850 RepID=A0A067C7J2_SAPPC|nr:hypothetical protein SPRG_20497 [Saprolegnia parasitica CBS 223.65]KDO26699.1 hypothetical protein SPRG_20497 [Saprolegnia parasitica CBS 223.65]|eukprot:XP_012202587.1 hypothetical protein SPRG_20497 [Saprolegnia parasitica CBS 223.65]